jgi:drug/metabolite transporter (DMT)-like permease
VATPTRAAVESVGWQLAYIILIASVVGVLSWNAGNRMLGATNGVLFINFVPITVFAIRIAQGHRFTPIEFVGAALVIGALIGNNLAAKRPVAGVRPQASRVRTAEFQGCG